MLKIAVNPNHKNKMPDGLDGSELRGWWRDFNGGFKNFTFPSVRQLIQAIGDGYAYTAQHTRYRKAENFKCGQHIGLDFDTGDERSSIEQLAENEFIQENASFIHTTPSHTERAPRTRVVFTLEYPIRRRDKYSLLTEAFADTFTVADQACKDPVRLFFGAEGCQVFELGNTLSLNAAAEIVNPYKTKLKERAIPQNGHMSVDNSPWLLEYVVDKVRHLPNGQKWYELGKWSRLAGGHVAAGYYTEWEATERLFQAIASNPTTRNLGVAKRRIEWGVRAGKAEPVYLKEDRDPIMMAMMA